MWCSGRLFFLCGFSRSPQKPFSRSTVQLVAHQEGPHRGRWYCGAWCDKQQREWLCFVRQKPSWLSSLIFTSLHGISQRMIKPEHLLSHSSKAVFLKTLTQGFISAENHETNVIHTSGKSWVNTQSKRGLLGSHCRISSKSKDLKGQRCKWSKILKISNLLKF